MEAAAVVLADDDEASTRVLLSATPARVSEGAGPTPVTVTAALDGGLRQVATTVTVSVRGSGDPGTVGFEAVPDFALEIPANAASGTATFTLSPEDDAVAEADETLTLAGASDLPVEAAEVVLADDDEASTGVLLSATPARVSEGAGPTPVTVTAALDGGLRQVATTVTVSVRGSGAPGAVDFEAVSDFAVEIPANAASGTATFTLSPDDDATAEADETLTLTGVSDLPVAPAEVVLADDDEASTGIALTADPSSASEGSGATTVTVTATLDAGARTGPSAVAVRVTGSGDPGVVDFAPVSSFTITIAAEAARGTGSFVLVPEDDAAAEADETLTLTGVSDLPVAPAEVVLADDDEASTRVVLSVSPARVSEGAGPVAVAVAASLDGTPRQVETTVTVSVTGGDDPTAVDFDAVADFDIVIPANVAESSRTFRLVPEDDAVDEADEVVTVSGISDVPVASASLDLADDDGAPVQIRLSVEPTRVSEGAGPVAVTVTAILDRNLRRAATAVTVSVTASGDSGTVDFIAVGDFEIVIPAEAASGAGTFTLTPKDDVVEEADNVLAVSGVSDLPVASAFVTLLDDDGPLDRPVMSVSDAAASETAGGLDFEVALDGPVLAPATVLYATRDGSATAGTDYRPAAGALTFEPGEVAKTIRVTLVDDGLDEVDGETFEVTLSGPRGATLGRASATGTIRDDDAPPALSLADAAASETDGIIEFVVTLSSPSGLDVAASFATADGTATAGSDYAAVEGTVEFGSGEVSAAIRVVVFDDALDEADEETFALSLSDARNAALPAGSATGTIRDDDLGPPTVVRQLPDVTLCVGGAVLGLDLDDHFAGEALRFSAVPTVPGVATTSLVDSRLTVAPVSEGEGSVTVTAVNAAGSTSVAFGVRVVSDPAELAAVNAALASVGRGVLSAASGSLGERFAKPRSFAVSESRAPEDDPKWTAVHWERWHAPIGGTGSNTGRERAGLSGPSFGTPNPPPLGDTPRFAFALVGSESGDAGRGDAIWTVWGRGDAQRFKSAVGDSSHDGAMTNVHLGVDAQVGDWLAGISMLHTAAEADYRFSRSARACGDPGIGEGLLEAEVTSVQPYGGRRLGRGWVWASAGVGRGVVSVERCDSGHRTEAVLRTRLGVLGGRHPFAAGDRIELSVVEELGVLGLSTESGARPFGDRSLSVGQARLGFEVAGVAPADCACSLSTFVRALARHDWGDGATGTGLELVAGIRYRNQLRRLGVDGGIRALALYSADDVEDLAANLALWLLPKADGTGWQGTLSLRRDPGRPGLDLAGSVPWTGHSGSGLREAPEPWLLGTRLGYGIAWRRGTAAPFLEFDAGRSAGGVRHEFGGIVVEWRIERLAEDRSRTGNQFVLTADGRF